MSPQEIEARFVLLEARIEANTTLTGTIKTDTAEMLDAFRALKGGFKVLEWIGKIAKPIGIIIAAIGTAWASFHLPTVFK
jgi:hypothetical protein